MLTLVFPNRLYSRLDLRFLYMLLSRQEGGATARILLFDASVQIGGGNDQGVERHES